MTTGGQIGFWVLQALLLVANIIYTLKFSQAKSYYEKLGENMATKKDLKEMTDIVEEVKTGFDTFKHEHNTRFTKLHEKRFEVIEEIFKRLNLVHLYSLQYTAPWKIIGRNEVAEDKEKERATNIMNSYNDLKSYWLGRDIYFKEEIVKKLDKILVDIRHNVQTYANSQMLRDEQSRKDAEKANTYLETEIPELLKELKAEFQMILGMNFK